MTKPFSYDEASSTVRLYMAVCEMQEGPNPLTEEELDKFAERRPRFKNAVESWKASQKKAQATKLILVMSDGETWEVVDKFSLVFEADEETFDKLESGSDPRELTEEDMKRMKAVSLLELYEAYKEKQL